jgi:lipoate-protein ligase A
MKYLDLTFLDPAWNLACDEALVDVCEAGNSGEILRLWAPESYFVVVGYSNRVAVEVDIDACAAAAIPVLRRFSGGGAVLQGPGCLNYTLVLKNYQPGSFADVGRSYQRVLERHKKVVEALTKETVQIKGTSDLAVDGRKISGNSQHRKHRHTVFHGTFLLHFDFTLVERFLRMPSRQPNYRACRSHEAFLKNLGVSGEIVRSALRDEWQASAVMNKIPYGRIQALSKTRYFRAEWNRKF